jgi:uncharacterized membrane protein YgcG
MKKTGRLLSVFLAFCIVFLMPAIVHAESGATDEGFYIQNMDVNVQVNEAREYVITETIDVYFLEERHGIYRNIGTQSAAERYEITNIFVEGAPADISSYGTSVDIQIGDPNETVTGAQQYVIHYTLDHFDDEVADADYLYLDVLGTEWTTYIEHFSATVTYPEHAVLNQYTVTGGSYGSTDLPDYLSCRQEGNQFFFESTERIPAYSGVTLNAEFMQGAFPQAPVFEYPYTVKQMNTQIEITKEKEYLIHSECTIDMKEGGTSAYLQIFPSGDDYKIKEVSLGSTSSSEYIYLSYDESRVCVSEELTGEQFFSIDMKIKPRMSEDILFDVTPHSFWSPLDAVVENLTLTVSSAVPIEGYKAEGSDSVTLIAPGSEEEYQNYDGGLYRDTFDYQISNDYKTLTVTSLQPFDALEREVALELLVDESLFSRPWSTGMIITLVISAVIFLLVCLFWLIFGRDRKLYPSVELYPPDGYNSAEAGYAIDQSLSSSDVTSLILYWASHRHLKIRDEDGSFTLERGEPLDSVHKKYEKKLYEAMFRKGDGTVVTQEDLYHRFYVDIGIAKKSISKSFSGQFSLMDKTSSAMRVLGVILACIPLFIYSITGADGFLMDVFTGLVIFGMEIIGLLAYFGVLTGLTKGYHRCSRKRKIVYWIIGIILTAAYLFMGITAYTWVNYPKLLTVLIVGLSCVSVIVSVFVSRRSRYGAYILERLIGYRQFMETAEKDRLEALLNEDPDYFYNTLPFAQVLGVTDIWCDKFRSIEMPPPNWYDSTSGMPFNYGTMVVFAHQIDRFSRDISSAPSSSGSGGGGGFSGGGFSGGGFSGGGSGGGGGGSW